MPSSPNYVRDYDQERKTAKKRGETGVGKKSGDAQRHRARRKFEKATGRKLDKDEHVDHKRTIKNGGTNNPKNLRVRSASDNMAAGGRSGSKAGKAAGGRKGK
ncbi:hypothetical protein [Escherichia phage PJNS034]